jgi:hypothetical protein
VTYRAQLQFHHHSCAICFCSPDADVHFAGSLLAVLSGNANSQQLPSSCQNVTLSYPFTRASRPISAANFEAKCFAIGDDDPFAGNVNFGVFANETGGKLFYNHNNVDEQIKGSERIGANFYTLTYQISVPARPIGISSRLESRS